MRHLSVYLAVLFLLSGGCFAPKARTAARTSSPVQAAAEGRSGPAGTPGAEPVAGRAGESSEEVVRRTSQPFDRPKAPSGVEGRSPSRQEQIASRNEELEKELDASRKRWVELEEHASEAIIRGLENRSRPEDGTPLVAALGEPFAKVRKYAAGALAKAGTTHASPLQAKEATTKLSELAHGDPSPEVRAECVTALGALGSDEATTVLIRALEDPNETVSAASARALGRLKAVSAVNPLLLALLSRSGVLRGSAAEALGEIGSPAAVDPLVELLGSDPEPGVRSQAARALGEIPNPSGRVVTALEKALADRSPAVRVYVVEALGALKVTRDAARISAVLREDGNPSVREAAAVALGKVGGADACRVLTQVLDHPEEKLAQLAASSLLAICQRDETLAEPTGDTLVHAGHPREAVPLYELLVQKLSDGKDDVRLTSVRVKLADAYCLLEQWAKAAPLLEELVKAHPTDVALAEKTARALTGLRASSEAFYVYRTLAGDANRDYWNERLVLLDMMLTDRKAAEVRKLVEESLGDKVPPPDDVRAKLDVFRRRVVGTMEEERKARSLEIQGLIRQAATGGEESKAAARIKLKARAEEAYPELVESLAGPDATLRRPAVELLRELTGQDFGYREEAGVEENADALRKWRTWLKTAGVPETRN